jgi:hypothetical protein
VIGTHLCCSIFFGTTADQLCDAYEAIAEPANAYLTRVGTGLLLADVVACETADWGRQLRLGTEMTHTGGASFSVFAAGDRWGMAVATDGVEGPVAVFEPDEEEIMADLPRRLLGVEKALAALSPERVDAAEVDRAFGALLEGVMTADDAAGIVLTMLGCHIDWPRWAWAETVPHQLFLDPDLADRVTPLGEAKDLWEE